MIHRVMKNGWTINVPEQDMYGGWEVTVSCEGNFINFLNNKTYEDALEKAYTYVESK